jgi:hypothetical protein
MVGEYVLSSAHNFSFTLEFSTFYYLSYFVAQKANVAPKVFTTRQVIQTDGLSFSSNPITKARRARAVLPQSFYPLNTEEERTLLVRGEETTPQVAKDQILMSQEYMYIRKTHNFPLISLWNANFKCVKWRKGL